MNNGKTFMQKSLSIGSLIFLGLIFSDCATMPKIKITREKDWVQASGTGTNILEADQDAKISMIENALGSIVESQSSAINGELQYKIATSSSSGFVEKYQRLSQENISGSVRVKAKGLVNFNAIGDALQNRRKEIGNPRMMVLIKETFLGKQQLGMSRIKNQLVEGMIKEGYTFIEDPSGNFSGKGNEIKTAADLKAEILIIADADIAKVPIPRDPNYATYNATFTYKIINVGNAEVLASGTETGNEPDMNDENGAKKAITEVIASAIPHIQKQIAKGWQTGSATQINFIGLTTEDFFNSGVVNLLKSMRGVNAVNEREIDANTQIVEVKCFCSSFDLVKSFTQKSVELDYKPSISKINGNSATISLKKR